jgi:hypothetical protein
MKIGNSSREKQDLRCIGSDIIAKQIGRCIVGTREELGVDPIQRHISEHTEVSEYVENLKELR